MHSITRLLITIIAGLSFAACQSAFAQEKDYSGLEEILNELQIDESAWEYEVRPQGTCDDPVHIRTCAYACQTSQRCRTCCAKLMDQSFIDACIRRCNSVWELASIDGPLE